MNLKWFYWYYQSAIPSKICDDILEYGLSQEKQMALTGEADDPSEEELKNIQKKRKSDVVWMSDVWIYREIQPYIHKANSDAGWNFQWDYTEPCQFTEYKKGQYYDWHNDSAFEPYYDKPDTNVNGKIRKLSMTLHLTNPEEYEGGDLEFGFHDLEGNKQPNICKEIRPKGSVIVFPSFIWHRVTPVTKGIRHSLVCWNLGQPYV